MSYLDKHLAYMNVVGNSVGEQQKNATAGFTNSVFTDSPFYKLVTVDGVQKDARIEDMTAVVRSNNFVTILNTNKYMILKSGDSANLGSIVEFDGLTWIATDNNSDDTLFNKSKLEQCNSKVTVITSTTTTSSGTDSMGRPITKTVPNSIDLPCIFSGNLTGSMMNGELNQPKDSVKFTLQYNDTSKLIKENDNYTFYDRSYKVKSIDFTNVFNGIGFITVMADRDVT
jgi:hypothetical protein